MALIIPGEFTGRIPQPLKRVVALNAAGNFFSDIEALYKEAVSDIVIQMAATGSPVLTDEERTEIFLVNAKPCTDMSVKLALSSPLTLSLIYPADGITSYDEPLSSLFELLVGNPCLALADESDRKKMFESIAGNIRPGQQVFTGVTAPINPHIESPEEVCDRILEAAAYIPLVQLDTTDACGFAPSFDYTSTSRKTGFAKIRTRVEGI